MITLEKLKQEGISPLAYLAYVFERSEIQASYAKASPKEHLPVDQLLLVGGQDTQGQDLVVKLLFAEDVAAYASREAGLQWSGSAGSTLQFWILNPSKIAPERMAEVEHLAGLVNRVTALGAFGVQRKDGLSLNYKLIGETQLFDPKLVIRVVHNLCGTYRYFQTYFEDCLSGKRPFAEIAKEVEALT